MYTNHLSEFVRKEIVSAGLAMNETSSSLDSRRLLLAECNKRGWLEEPLSPNLSLFSHQGVTVGGILHHMPSTTGRVGDEICKSKALEKKVYELRGIPTLPSETFDASDMDGASEYAKSRPVAVVVKPARGSMGSGITVGVESADEFSQAWERASKVQHGKGKILIEDFAGRLDTRVLVLDGEPVAASTRVPPYIIGDGVSTRRQLIDELKETRRQNAYLKKHPLRIDETWLSKCDIPELKVLADGEIVFLNLTSNASRGGITVNTFDRLSDDLKDLASSVAQAIPGTPILGVDVFSKTLDSAEGAYVLETNSTPQIGVHHDTTFGQPFDAAAAVIDQMASCASR